MQFIELLSPAKDLECGISAINHGADAVYIGASNFSARAAASNSIGDIEKLVKYAHSFHSKVFVALNTVLTDDQLLQAEKLIHDIYEAGADAIIIQDMAILQMNIPPIALHASTQTDNRSFEKVKFLEDVGFSRVVLARELNLNQISHIRSKTAVELEAFVHGALCVSYSGQCYMSQANSGRSANRGKCAQYCRLPYHLIDSDGKVLAKNKHLLSLKDLDLSDYLKEMMEAGIVSFKIEGRLKGVDYVKNITAYYRKKLDAILEGNNKYRQSSSGKTIFFFEPNPEKSFRRSATDYFLHGRKVDISQPETPKSLGEPLGKITYIGKNYFELPKGYMIHNGDGLCFLNQKNELTGFRVNRVEASSHHSNNKNVKCFPSDMPRMNEGVFLYRNHDHEFEKILKGKTSQRSIDIIVQFEETNKGFDIHLTDEQGTDARYSEEFDKQLAKKTETTITNIRTQLSKLGNTIYNAKEIKIQISSPWFLPSSQLNEWRRKAVEILDTNRLENYQIEARKKSIPSNFPLNKLSYLGNVTNSQAEKFYKSHGVYEIQQGFEVKAEADVPLMFCKHCIKHTMGWCPKNGTISTFKEPLFLRNNDQIYMLTFDCKACEMHIIKHECTN